MKRYSANQLLSDVIHPSLQKQKLALGLTGESTRTFTLEKLAQDVWGLMDKCERTQIGKEIRHNPPKYLIPVDIGNYPQKYIILYDHV